MLNPTVKANACALVIAFLGATSSVCSAHSRWLLPSHTIVSGDEATVIAVDFSISNDFFHPDISFGGQSAVFHRMPGAGEAGEPRSGSDSAAELLVHYPDGKLSRVPYYDFGRKSTAAFELDQSGTYRINVQQPPLMLTFYKDKNGNPARAFGAYEQIKETLPQDISDIETMGIHSRIETYVTRNQLSEDVFTVASKGLFLAFSNHPNDLFVGEKAILTLYFNGKPVAENTPVKLTQGGTRYRNNRQSTMFKTDARGQFPVVWSEAGAYLLEAEIEQPGSTPEVNKDYYSLFVTLEVNPE